MDTVCNCCPPSACNACMPQCSAPYVRIRAERPLNYIPVCGIKNCSIFGGHDTNSFEDYECHQKRKIRDENKNSLGSAIGLAASNINFKTDGDGSDITPARFATYLKAFARLHLNDEKTWDTPIMDDVMKEGLDLFTRSAKSKSNTELLPSDVYMRGEECILREFQLSDFTFHVELKPPFKLNVSNSSKVGANGDGVELTLEDLIPALKAFFRDHKYGLLSVGPFYAMVWRTKDAYFVLDVCGRRVSDFIADRSTGVAMLMCFASLHNVRHLIVNLSGLQTSDPLIIRELKVVKVITPNGSIMQQDYGKRSHQYEVVNDDYAYLRSDLHLSLNRSELLRNRSGLPVAVTAIVASKIDHPATWDIKMLDKIICFGVNFCQSIWQKCKIMEDIDVREFPTYFTMGQFDVSVELVGRKYEGTWRCVPGYRQSELARSIKKAFDDGYSKLIVQINQQMYAIWKKNEFIYLLDPYRHRIVGKQQESEAYEEMEKSATLRMLRSFDVFMNVFNQILLDSNRTSPFYIHTVGVKNIQIQQNEKQANARPVEEPKLDGYGEIISINEHICFEEGEENCKAVLAEISDYEDEDLKSDVDEIELRTSSSEEELLEEEGAGDLEDMEGLESSSSGGEGGTRRARGRRGRGRTIGGKRGKGKKGSPSRRKKEGEGADDDVDYDTEDGKSKRRGGRRTDDDKTMKGIKGEEGKRKKTRSTDRTGASDDGLEGTSEGRGMRKGTRKRKDKHGGTYAGSISEDEAYRGEGEGGVPSRERDSDLFRGGDSSEDLDTYIDGSMERDGGRGRDRSRGRDASKARDGSMSKDGSRTRDGSRSRDGSRAGDRSKQKYIGKGDDTSKDKEHSPLGKRGASKSALDGEKDNNKENKMYDSNKISEKDRSKGIGKRYPRGKSREAVEKSSKRSLHGKDRQRLRIDGTEADDENEEYFKKMQHYSCFPNPNSYPGYYKFPVDMAIVGSESGSYQSICKLFHAAFRVADRLLLMTPWDNFVIFRCTDITGLKGNYYFLFDGCTCNLDRFRHLDLSVGTAGLICFEHLHNVIEYIRHLRKSRRNYRKEEVDGSAENICKQYFNKTLNLRL